MKPEQAASLRASFHASQIGKLPRAGIQLDYVGHAAVTDRLLLVDPAWSWEPVAFDEFGAPLVTYRQNDAVMWIRLTVCDVTRLGVGIVQAKAFELEKQLISDALRNAAMRFGVALDLWSKEDLGAESSGSEPSPPPSGSGSEPSVEAPRPSTPAGGSVTVSPPGAGPPAHYNPGGASLEKAISRCSALAAIGVDIRRERDKRHLPELKKVASEAQWGAWQQLLDLLEARADREAERAVKA